MVVKETGSGMAWPKARIWKPRWIRARFQKRISPLYLGEYNDYHVL
jgi:hypothetical protein